MKAKNKLWEHLLKHKKLYNCSVLNLNVVKLSLCEDHNNFIGFERDEEYFNIAKNRIKGNI